MVRKLFKSNKTLRVIKLRDFLVVPSILYRLGGIKFFKWNDKDLWTLGDKLQLAFTLILFLINWICMLSYVLFDTFENTLEMAEYALYVGFALNGIIKMFSVVLGRKQLFNVLKEIEKIFPNSLEEQKDFGMDQGYAYINRHIKVMVISHMFIAIIFMIFPFFQSMFEYVFAADKNAEFVRRTPYIMTYPFDWNNWPGYTFVYVSQMQGGGTLSLYFLGSDILLLCVIFLINMNYRYLCKQITKFESKGFEEDMKELRRMLKLHSDLNE